MKPESNFPMLRSILSDEAFMAPNEANISAHNEPWLQSCCYFQRQEHKWKKGVKFVVGKGSASPKQGEEGKFREADQACIGTGAQCRC